MSISESALTGETENIRKKPDRDPFLYAGTQVGHARVFVHVHVSV